jgi:hypothetical protein
MTHWRLVLLPSPLLGPAVWAPVAGVLRDQGQLASVATVRGQVGRPADVVRGFLAELPEHEPLVLVPHSNAGLYVAALAAARTVAGVVFVDAGLPSSEASTPTAPAGLREHLADLADADGLLPPWTRWWPDLDHLFPDTETRRLVEVEERRLPLGYFHDAVPTPSGWEALPAAYLSFGDTYGDERAEARSRRWPERTLDGGHLHMLVDPQAVAHAVLRLAESLVGD